MNLRLASLLALSATFYPSQVMAQPRPTVDREAQSQLKQQIRQLKAELHALRAKLNDPNERPMLPPQDFVSWWTGDATADDVAGTNDGTLQNGVKFQRGRLGQAFSFDGVNHYVDVGDVGISETFPFTIVAWFQADAATELAQPRTIYGEGNTDGRAVYQLWMTREGKLQIYTQDDSGIVRTPLESSATVHDGRFHHVAVVHESSDDHKLYVDGILVDKSDVDIGTRTVTESRIGNLSFRRDPGEEQFWKGLVDEVQVFKRALKASEIQLLCFGEELPSDAVTQRQLAGARHERIDTTEFVVDAKRNHENPVRTKIRLKAGEVIVLEPNEQDRWRAQGPESPGANFAGLGRTDSLLTLYFRVGKEAAPVTNGRALAVTSAGELELFCKDEQPRDNVGQVRVKVTRLRVQK